MRMSEAIDLYVSDMVADGRFNSWETEKSYRACLTFHAEDVGNRDPRTVGREDVIRTLRRWQHPNTRSLHRSQLVSFYDWCVETGLRKDNPARQTRRSKARRPVVYRLTREEVRAFRAAARGWRERAVVDFGVLAGLRADELRHLQGRHLRRPGWVWVSADIAKGSNERWVPVLAELEPTFAECSERTADGWFVIPNRKRIVAGPVVREVTDPTCPASYKAILAATRRIGVRAGIAAPVTTHMMRHAFGDHIARFAGLKVAQFVLGHQSVQTTEGYTGAPTLDEVAGAMAGFGYGELQLPAVDRASKPLVVPVGSQGGLSPVCDPQRDWSRVGGLLSPVLWFLWQRPAFREAARAVPADA